MLTPTQEMGQMFYPGIKRVTDTIFRDILYVWLQDESDTGFNLINCYKRSRKIK